jgi:hypothetical protein
MPLTSGPSATSAATRAGTESNVDWVKYDVTAPRNSQITLKFDYSMRTRTCGGVESNQGVKVNQMGVAPLLFGHRSLLRRALLRRCMVVDSDGELRRLLQLRKMLSRRGSSPGGFLEGRRRRLLTEASVVSPTPARCCGRDRRIPGD